MHPSIAFPNLEFYPSIFLAISSIKSKSKLKIASFNLLTHSSGNSARADLLKIFSSSDLVKNEFPSGARQFC